MGDFRSASATVPSVIVIGAGAGGVTIAAILAAAGCKVTIVGKGDSPGEHCNLIRRQGYLRNQLQYLLEERFLLIQNTEI
ncbi:HI0933 multi-domain protein [Pyrenophora tritici-repentis]|nr:HI0933 multi-domain protein [Pyrenophora tritici-repentis]